MRILIFVAFAIVVSVIGAIAVYLKKGRMSRALGREVGDHELTSLTSWMEVSEKESGSTRREAATGAPKSEN